MQTAHTSRRVLIAVAVVLGLNSQLNTRHLVWLGKVPNAVVKTLANPPKALLRKAVVTLKGEQQTPTFVAADANVQELRESLSWAYRENNALWEENNTLRRQLDAFRAAAAARGSDTPRYEDALVTDANLSRSNPTLELDKGSRSGIEPGNPVVVGANLIGFIQDDVGALRSTAQLVTAPGSQYRVRLVPPGEQVSDDNEPIYIYADPSGEYFYCDLPDGRHNVREGDLAAMADELYRQAYGYVLGEVVAVNNDHPDKPLELDRILIRSAVQPDRLRGVVIQVKE